MSASEKIKRMHQIYGKDICHQCGDCCSFDTKRYRGMTTCRCVAHGAATFYDLGWSRYHVACGRFGIPFDPKSERTVIEQLQQKQAQKGEISGQVRMEGLT